MVLFPVKSVGGVKNPSLHIFVPSFAKISQKVSKLLSGHYFQIKFAKGHSLKKCRSSYGSAHRLITLYICTKFRENISKSFKVFEQTRFPNRNFPRGIIQKTVSGVMFFSLHII